MELLNPVLREMVIMDQEQLNLDILSTLPDNPLYIAHIKELKPCWSVTPDRFLCHDNLIYIPNLLRYDIWSYGKWAGVWKCGCRSCGMESECFTT